MLSNVVSTFHVLFPAFLLRIVVESTGYDFSYFSPEFGSLLV